MQPGPVSAPRITPEKIIQLAALRGDYGNFMAALIAIKKKHRGKLPPEVIRILFYSNNDNLLISIANLPPDTLLANKQGYTEIVLEMLNHLSLANICIGNVSHLWGTLLTLDPHGKMNSAYPQRLSRPLYDIAHRLQLSEIFNHHLVRQEAAIHNIQQTFLKGSVQLARVNLTFASQSSLAVKACDVLNEDLINDLIIRQEPPTPEDLAIMTQVVDDLMTHNDVLINTTLWHSITAGDFLNSANTIAYRLMTAIKNDTPDMLPLLELYFSHLPVPSLSARYASGLLECCLVNLNVPHDPPIVLTPAQVTAQINVLKALLARGAIANDLPYQTNQLQWLLENGTQGLELLKFRGIINAFKTANNDRQKETLQTAMACISTGDDSEKLASPPAVRLLCQNIPSSDRFSIDEFLQYLIKFGDPLNSDASLKPKRDLLFKSLRYLMQYELIDVNAIKPGSHSLPFQDPDSKVSPVDLHKFIMCHADLKAGFMVHIRDEELLRNYTLVRAMMQHDHRSESEVAELDRTITNVMHGEHPHQLSRIRDFVKNYPLAGLHIAKELDPSILPADTRLKTANRLSKRAEQADDQEDKRDRSPKKSG